METGYFVMNNPAKNNKDTITSAMNSPNPPQTSSAKMTLTLPVPSQYPPAYSNDYLTPTNPEPPGAQRPQLPAFPAGGFSHSTSRSPPVVQEGGEDRSFPRADSGIEADFPRSPLCSTATDNPRSSTIYESVDHGNIYTDPSPHTFHRGRSTEGESHSSGVSSSPATANLLGATSDTEDGLDDNIRHRVNPVYTTLNKSTPQLYTDTCLCHSPKSRGTSSPRCVRYLWCGFIILTVIIVFLLAIIAYIFFLLIPGMQAQIRTQEDGINRMETEYKNLSQRVDALLWSSTSHQSTLAATSETLADRLTDKMTQLNDSVTELSSQLHQVTTDLHLQIDNVSQTIPDLQGLSGVGHLSHCFYHNAAGSQILPGPSSTTPWMPRTGSDTIRDNMVMSATCAVEGGTEHYVETQEPSSGVVQYRCRCDGRAYGANVRRCVIHLVLCPRLLSVDLAVASP